ncbi:MULTISPECIES: hypothetical protein [unclassified Nodularia (in: cyanobacteria)]|uniref:hypothetical protein n=1 Tax=unclassified Nodularia (in: cyanobacteria) TaxID=2656917 RepID=UPI001D12E0BB|nr:hypothetical protein [Nodularia sp. LEGE 04288]MCC2695909.1 hypothetical protein [Nodularia sp. LEGE 04288]
MSVAAVRGCMLMGFPTWAGLFSLTFGSTFILVGAFHSSGFYGWAVAKELVLTNKKLKIKTS